MVACSHTAVAAAVIIASVIRVARTAMTPSPRPGKTYTLLHWATGMLRPFTVIGGNGEPAATSARPPVQSARSCGRASLREVGLDSGMMIGRSGMRGHLPHDGLGERAGRGGQADQRGGPRRRDHGGEAGPGLASGR